MNECSVDGCHRSVENKTRQLCDPHYKRVWRTGDVQADIPLAPQRNKPSNVVDYADGTRECQGCGNRLPLSDFHNDARSPLGKRKTCKGCRTKQEAARYHSDAKRVRARMARYRADNLDKVRAADMARYERDKEKRLVLAVANSHLRRARIANNGWERGVTITALRNRDGDTCHYCGIELVFASFAKKKRPANQATIEHLTPISRGGGHTFANCALSCWACNSSKGAGDYPKRLMMR